MAAKELLNKYLVLHKKALESQFITKENIIKKFHHTRDFVQALNIEVINRPNDPAFSELYSLYSGIFTLPDESETMMGFEKTLELNSYDTLLKEFGFYEELWLYACMPDTNEIIAGINFTYYKVGKSKVNQYDFTKHITYLFVKNEYRGLGIASHLLKAADEYVLNKHGQNNTIINFCEQNAPELMTTKEYFLDNINALVDQCDRLIWWHKQGYRRLAFNYVQPALNENQNPYTKMTMNIQYGGGLISSEIVRFHLERFFSITVLKGDIQKKDSLFYDQLKYLRLKTNIKTVGDPKYYMKLRDNIYATLDSRKPLKQLY